MTQYRPMALGTARRWHGLLWGFDLEDIEQIALMGLWRAINNCKGTQYIFSFIARRCISQALTLALHHHEGREQWTRDERKRFRETQYSADVPLTPGQPDTLVDLIVSPTRSPEDIVIGGMQEDAFLRRITGRDRTIFNLYLQDWTHKEIGAFLRIPTPTVNGSIYRSRQVLAAEYEFLERTH